MHTTNPMSMDPEAWRKGYAAGMKRKGGNPYPAHDARGWAWQAGYIEGRGNQDRLPLMRNVPMSGL